MFPQAATKGTIRGCWVSRMLSGREQALQSFVASWRTGIGIGIGGGLIDTRSVAATFTFGIFL